MVRLGTVHDSETLSPLRPALRSVTGWGSSSEGGRGGPGVPQPASNPVNAIANKSVTSAGFMKGEQQNNRRGLQPTDSRATAGAANYATSSFTPSRKTRVCWSMSEASVCGDINAILWNGVSRMPRFMA